MKKRIIIEKFNDFLNDIDYHKGDSKDIDELVYQLSNDQTSEIIDEIEYLIQDYNEAYPDDIINLANANMFGEYDYIASIIAKLQKFSEENDYYFDAFDFNNNYSRELLEKLIKEYVKKHNK